MYAREKESLENESDLPSQVALFPFERAHRILLETVHTQSEEKHEYTLLQTIFKKQQRSTRSVKGGKESSYNEPVLQRGTVAPIQTSKRSTICTSTNYSMHP